MTVKKIYDCLINSAKTTNQIRIETGLDRNTIFDAFDFFIKKKMIKKERKGHEIFYEMVKDPPTYFGWEIQWFDMMLTDEDWEVKMKDLDYYIKKNKYAYHITEANDSETGIHLTIIQKRITKFYEDAKEIAYEKFMAPFPKFLELMIKKNMMDKSVIIFRENWIRPYCLVCLESKGILIQTIEEEGTYTCTECGCVATPEVPAYVRKDDYGEHKIPKERKYKSIKKKSSKSHITYEEEQLLEKLKKTN